MAIENSFQITYNALTPTEQEFGEMVFSYEIYSTDNVFHVQEDADDDWNALSAAAQKVASYPIPVNLVHESVIPCRAISVIGESGGGVAYVKVIPQQSNRAISDAEVYETRTPMR